MSAAVVVLGLIVLFLLGREDFMFTPHVLRGYNNYDVKEASDEAGTDPGDEPSMTQQHFRDECDINVIVERYGLLGELPVDARAPMYGDFTGVSDFRQAMDMMRAADEAFMQLPAKVRLRFDNDPEVFVDFCNDPSNIEEMREMGLAVTRENDDGKERGRGDGRVGAPDRREVASPGGGGRGDAVAAGGSQGGARPGAGDVAGSGGSVEGRR